MRLLLVCCHIFGPAFAGSFVTVPCCAVLKSPVTIKLSMLGCPVKVFARVHREAPPESRRSRGQENAKKIPREAKSGPRDQEEET